jgi:hypothetical protein
MNIFLTVLETFPELPGIWLDPFSELPAKIGPVNISPKLPGMVSSSTWKFCPEPIVLVIWKSVCFLNLALLPRDLKARGLKSARSHTFDKIVQN